MEWNNEDALALIQEYQKHPLLWNPKHPWHFNKIKKNDAWDEIAKACDFDVEELKNKMASLLGSFRREKAKGTKTIGTGKGAKEVYKTNWFAFKSLLFLTDRDDPRPTINSETTSNDNSYVDEESLESTGPTVLEGSSQISPENVSQLSEQEAESTSLEDINITQKSDKRPIECNNFVKPTEPKRKRAKKQADVEDPRIEQAFQFIQQPIQEDSNMIYAQYVANKLKQFEGRSRILLEHAINQLIFEAELGKFDHIHPQRYSPAYPNNISSGSLANQTSSAHQQPEILMHVTEPASPYSYSSQSSACSVSSPLDSEVRSPPLTSPVMNPSRSALFSELGDYITM